MQPRVTDNDKGEISIHLSGGELRGWSYANDTERRQKMAQARDYLEGWHDGRLNLLDDLIKTERQKT